MVFEEGHLYHLFNQGNNREQIFYSRENYLFFLNKIQQHILPHADILAWCLMPNHFHLMIYVNTVKIAVAGPADELRSSLNNSVDDFESSAELMKKRMFTDSIAIMLRSTPAPLIYRRSVAGLFSGLTPKPNVLPDMKVLRPHFIILLLLLKSM